MAAELIVADDLPNAAASAFVKADPRVVALAGGTTPRPFYERLATASLGHPWEEVHVLLTDERCVPPHHPDSNFRMVDEALLSRLRPKGPRVHRMSGEDCDPDASERELREVFATGVPRLDVAVLGLGEDGHTASLFPGDPALEERDRWVVRVERPDHARLTLSLPVLSSARLALFLVSGEAKRGVLHRFMTAEDMPATRVRAERVAVIADPAAAG